MSEATDAAAEEPAPSDGGEEPTPLERVVTFEHAFFRLFPDLYFRISEHTRKPVLVLCQGDNELVLSFEGIRREFGLEQGSHDARMLESVAQSLDYVRGLRPGDTLPSEVLTGEPSWDVTDHHREVASQRLTMQLVTWLTGKEVVSFDPRALQELAGAPETAERIRRALREASDQLGLEDGESEVVNRIERLVEELAYVEALRETFEEVKEVQGECREILRVHARETSIVELATPVIRLIDRAVEDFESSFKRIDEQTSEVVPSIRDVDEHCASLSTERNGLYVRLRPWQDLFDLWSASGSAETAFGIADLLRATYRFLAPRYLEFYEWVLATKPPPADPAQPAQRESAPDRPRRRRYGGVMRW